MISTMSSISRTVEAHGRRAVGAEIAGRFRSSSQLCAARGRDCGILTIVGEVHGGKEVEEVELPTRRLRSFSHVGSGVGLPAAENSPWGAKAAGQATGADWRSCEYSPPIENLHAEIGASGGHRRHYLIAILFTRAVPPGSSISSKSPPGWSRKSSETLSRLLKAASPESCQSAPPPFSYIRARDSLAAVARPSEEAAGGIRAVGEGSPLASRGLLIETVQSDELQRPAAEAQTIVAANLYS
jgi:hypothetical protein